MRSRHQREPEPRPAVLGRGQLVHLEELVEDELLIVRADADARVDDLAAELSRADARPDLDPALASELGGIVQQQEGV